VKRHGFHTVTLGCKLNQFDSAAIEGELARRGYAARSDAACAEIVVINTCTVTHRADADARKQIRRVRRVNPDCRLLVTGCYAELDAEAIRALDGVDRVFGNPDKPRIGQILDDLDLRGPLHDTAAVAPRGDRGCEEMGDLFRALHFGDRNRAYLKIQDGCRLACSYCIIPVVRGPSRSVPADEIERAALALFGQGYREIVLTGVNTGDYGRDLRRPTNLASLLRRLLDVAGPNRLRLNSLEPLTVTDEIIRIMARDPRLAPHLQVPLQSGSPAILRRMRRNYRLEAYLDRVERLRAAVPHAGLGADVIVGFPGETEALFRETYEFIKRSPLTYLHVFAWSPRPGTPASALSGRVPSAAVRERSARLRELAADKSLAFRRRFIGQKLDAVVLGPRKTDRRLRALTGNFIEVLLDTGSAPRGQLASVRIDSVERDQTQGQADGTPPWADASPAFASGR